MAYQRTDDIIQPMLDEMPQATQYFSDDMGTYHTLVYSPGHHQALSDKSQTYSVEGDNADLRHRFAWPA